MQFPERPRRGHAAYTKAIEQLNEARATQDAYRSGPPLPRGRGGKRGPPTRVTMRESASRPTRRGSSGSSAASTEIDAAVKWRRGVWSVGAHGSGRGSGGRRRDTHDAFAGRRRVCGKHLGAIGLAYRAWAAARPHRYRAAVQTRLGSGERGTRARDPAAQRAMAVILDAIEDLPKARQPKPEPTADLRAHLDAWAQHVGGQPRPPAALLRDVIFWSRLHGLSASSSTATWPPYNSTPSSYRAELAELGGQL